MALPAGAVPLPPTTAEAAGSCAASPGAWAPVASSVTAGFGRHLPLAPRWHSAALAGCGLAAGTSAAGLAGLASAGRRFCSLGSPLRGRRPASSRCVCGVGLGASASSGRGIASGQHRQDWGFGSSGLFMRSACAARWRRQTRGDARRGRRPAVRAGLPSVAGRRVKRLRKKPTVFRRLGRRRQLAGTVSASSCSVLCGRVLQQGGLRHRAAVPRPRPRADHRHAQHRQLLQRLDRPRSSRNWLRRGVQRRPARGFAVADGRQSSHGPPTA